MKRLDTKLKLSVSLLALMSGGSLLASAATAETLSGEYDAVVIASDTDEVIADDTVVITPGGLLVQGDVAGDFINQGSIEFNDTPSAGGASDLIADAVAVDMNGMVGGDVMNVGSISAMSDASVSLIADESDEEASVSYDAMPDVEAYATGVDLDDEGSLDGDFTNTGTIEAAANAEASADTSVASDVDASTLTGGGYAYSEAVGVSADMNGGAFTNSADADDDEDGEVGDEDPAMISADATSSVDIGADVTGTSANLYTADSEIGSAAYADALEVDGASSVWNDGEISATADSAVTLDALATATDGDAMIGGDDEGDLYSEAGASGVWVTDLQAEEGAEDMADVTNEGSVSGSANASMDIIGDATSTNGSAMVDGRGAYVDSWAGGLGVDMPGEDGVAVDTVDNSGDVSADASSSLVQDFTATGDDGATVMAGGGVFSSASGLYAADVQTEIANSGSISASATADSSTTASATVTDDDDETGNAMVSGEDATVASAWGVVGENASGSFLNAEDGEITADASATSTRDLSASAEMDATVNSSNMVMADAVGVALSGGSHEVTNDGAITATATATNDITASADSTAGTGTVNQSGMTVALAGGIWDTGTAEGFTNTGDITATSTASSTVDLSATGSTVNSENLLVSAAGGAIFLQPVEGSINNAGTISADASGTLDVTQASGTEAEPGNAAAGNYAGVLSVGMAADIDSPDEEGADPYVFENSGDITATGDLTVNVAQPDSTAPAPTQESYGVLGVAGAVVWGDVNSISNSGTISADGSLNTTGMDPEADGVGTAAASIGLWLPDAGDGTVIDNSGEISANLTGNAEHSAAVGLMLGPVPDGLLEDILADEGFGDTPLTSPLPGTSPGTGLEAAAAGVITVNNTGTISGTNDTEGGLSYGIFGETAPVPLVINQMDGSISGGTAAIAMDQGNADTLNWSGGSISGLVDADENDVVNVIQNGDEDTTVTAGQDFALDGAGQLNVGAEDNPVTFVMNGVVTNTGEANLNTDATLVVGPTGEINVGTYNQAEGSTLRIQFAPGQAGLITTEGDANIDGTLETQALAGLYDEEGSHVVLDAGGTINGEYDEIDTVGDTLLLDFTTQVNESDITVSWDRNGFDEVEGLDDNAQSVAGAIEAGYDPDRDPTGNEIGLNDQLAGLFTLTDAEQYREILNSWSGSEHAQMMQGAVNLSQPYLMALSEHLNDNRNTGMKEQRVVMLRPKGSSQSIAPASAVGQSGAEESGLAFWGRGFGQWSEVDGDMNADGFDADTYGAVLGMDFRLSPQFLLGVAGSYIDSEMDFDDGDSGDIRRWSIGAYASAQFDALYLDGSVTYGKDRYKVDRTIIVGGAGDPTYSGTDSLSSRYKGDVWIAHAETGFNWDLGETAKLQPFAGLNYTSVDHDGFTETGGGDLALVSTDGTGKSLQSRLGARLSGQWGSGDTVWIPELRAEWRHEFKDNPAWIQSSFTGLPGQPFTTVGSDVGDDIAVVGAGITAQFQGGWGLYFDYEGQFASGYDSHTAQGGVRVKF